MTFFKKSASAALCAALIFTVFLTGPQARAQEDAQGLMPAETSSLDAGMVLDEETHPPLRLTPDKSQIMTLDQDIERVIIGNETHMNILMDTPNRLVIIPRIPGATYFTLLGENGKVLMQRYAIIAAPEEKYLRIRQPCGGAADCMPIRMFYCPGMCHEIGITGEGNTSYSGSMTASDDGKTLSTGSEGTGNKTEDSDTSNTNSSQTGSEKTSGEK